MTEFAEMLNYIPLWGLFILAVVLSFAAFEFGLGVSKFAMRKGKIDKEKKPLDSMAGAMLGLLGFILAFTFSLAATRFDSRREVVLDEANAIGTTYLRSGYLEEPFKSTVRTLLKEYVDVRLDAVRMKKFEEASIKSNEIHGKLWEQVVSLVEKGYTSPPVSLFISSMNDVIDLHAKRIMLSREMRVPGTIWLALFFIMALSMGVIGYFAGIKQSRDLAVNLSVIIAFSAVIYLITDLDRPQEGALRTSQKPLIDVQNMMSSES